jgi:hypothetical protein
MLQPDRRRAERTVEPYRNKELRMLSPALPRNGYLVSETRVFASVESATAPYIDIPADSFSSTGTKRTSTLR